MSHHPGSESDQKDPRKSMNEGTAPAAIGLKVGAVQTLVIKGDVIVQAGNKGDNKHERTRNNFTAMKMACNGGNFTATEHGATNTLAVQPPSGDTSAKEPSTSDSQSLKKKSDASQLDEGIFPITDDIFINWNKPLRKGFKIYEGYQEHVNGKRIALAIKAIIPYQKKDTREVDILVDLAWHPNVVQIICSKVQQTHPPTLYIAMELCNPKTLQDYLEEKREKNSPLDFKKAMSHSKGLIGGMKHIHGYRIIHGDLKPQNIVFSLKGDLIKVTDFGISKQLQDNCSVTNMTGVGTHGYRAPETYNSDPTSLMADIFSLGITLYSIFTNGKHPFGQDLDLWVSNIKKNKGRDISGLPEEIRHERDEFLNLLDNMLEYDPKKRPTMEKISEHPFFSDNQAITAQVSTKLEGTNYDQPSTSHHPDVMEQTSTGAISSAIDDPNEETLDSLISKTSEESGNSAVHRNKIMKFETVLNDATASVTKVKVRNSTEASYIAHLTDNKIYQIHPNRRKGKVLIINNAFLGRVDEREGSEVDVRNMSELWTALGFDIEKHADLSAQEMSEFCRSFAAESRDVSVVVVIIMSHGGRTDNGTDFLLGEDKCRIPVPDITAIFSFEISPHLQGTPKLFIFQTCRIPDGGSHTTDARNFPQQDDMLISHATQSGFNAMRTPGKGSWFINAITNVFMQHAHDTHAMDMFTMVNDVVANKRGYDCNEDFELIQISNQDSCLRRKLFLFSGWPN